MAPDQYDADINIEGFRIWKIKIADQSFGMDILGTEQEILSLFHNMCHVIIRAIAAVTDIDIFYSIQNIVPDRPPDGLYALSFHEQPYW